MIGFIVPFKQRTDRNWDVECFNLEKTLYSICNQSNKAFRVFVVYTDYPDITFKHEQVEFIRFPFPLKTQDEITKMELQFNPDDPVNIDVKGMDHGSRLMYGSMHAKNAGCDYVMPVDADDFISNRIAQWVFDRKSTGESWYVDKGYIKNKNSRFLVKIKKNMRLINGSTHIIHVSLLPAIKFEQIYPSLMCFLSAHAYLKDRLKVTVSVDLQPLPFYGIIYYLHGGNWLGFQNLIQVNKFKYYLKKVLFGAYLTKALRNEFGVDSCP